MPHPEHEATLLSPVSKLNAAGAPYALLDFSVCSPGMIRASWLVWWPLHSDHAMLVNEIVTSTRQTKPKRGKSKWRPKNADAVVEVTRAGLFFDTMSKDELCERVKEVQDLLQDNRSCAQRCAARIPDDIRALQARVTAATDAGKTTLRKECEKKMRVHRSAMRRHTVAERVKKGKSPFGACKLHNITAVTVSVAQASGGFAKVKCQDVEIWAPQVTTFFEQKWKCNNSDREHRLRGLCKPEDLASLSFEQDEMVRAGFCLNKTTRLHKSGTCTEVWKRLAGINISFVNSFNALVKRVETWENLHIDGYVKGKLDSSPEPDSMRAILPLCPFSQLCDALLAERLHEFIDTALPEVTGVHCGAKKGRQSQEIPAALQFACEKCQDYGIRGAIAQVDVLQHYDNLDMCVIGEWLLDKGAPNELVAGLLLSRCCLKSAYCSAGKTCLCQTEPAGP